MKPDRMVLSTLIPLLSLISVAIIGLGLGAIFIAINDHWTTIGIGMALVVGVPVGAVLLEKKLEGDILSE